MANAWLRRSPGDLFFPVYDPQTAKFYREKHRVLPLMLGNLRVSRRHDYLKHAQRLHSKDRYDSALTRVLFRGCRGRKQRSPIIALPAENIAAIQLLNSWLSTPDVERDEFQERLDRLVQENRL